MPMKNPFLEILKKISRDKRALNDHKKRSFEWFRGHATEIRREARKLGKDDVTTRDVMVSRPELLSKRRVIQNNMIGSMYFFYYDPKLKSSLPYYDTFPLVMPMSVTRGRMTGIAFHYLPPNARAILMGHLYSLLEDEPDGEKRIGLSYGILKAASKYRLFQPCIKSYLIKHVRSKFRKVDPKEWDLSLQLPLASFSKASEIQVWNDSLKMVNENTKKNPRGTK